MEKEEKIQPIGEEKETTKITVEKDGVEEKKEMRKPTEEDIEKFKEEFSRAQTEFEQRRWQISEPGIFGINDVGMYLLEFMDKYAFWSKTEWMGMIKMDDEIRKAMTVSDPSVGIALSYQALEFCAYMLSNPGGTGIKLAKQFDEQADKYSKVGMVVGAQVEEARKKLKEVQFLQETWAASLQGLFLEDIIRDASLNHPLNHPLKQKDEK